METRANMLVVAKHCVICYVNRAAKFGSQVQFMLTFFSLSISFLPSQHYIQIPSNLQTRAAWHPLGLDVTAWGLT